MSFFEPATFFFFERDASPTRRFARRKRPAAAAGHAHSGPPAPTLARCDACSLRSALAGCRAITHQVRDRFATPTPKRQSAKVAPCRGATENMQIVHTQTEALRLVADERPPKLRLRAGMNGRRPALCQGHIIDNGIPRPNRRARVTGRRPLRTRPLGRITRTDRSPFQNLASCRLTTTDARRKLRRPHAVRKMRVGRRPVTGRSLFARSP